jgi:hypothetical protein
LRTSGIKVGVFFQNLRLEANVVTVKVSHIRANEGDGGEDAWYGGKRSMGRKHEEPVRRGSATNMPDRQRNVDIPPLDETGVFLYCHGWLGVLEAGAAVFCNNGDKERLHSNLDC